MIITSSEFARKLASEADRAAQLDDRSAARLREALEPQQTSLDVFGAEVRGEHHGTRLDPILTDWPASTGS